MFRDVLFLKCLVFHVIKESIFWFVSKTHSIAASPRRIPLWILEKHSETSVLQKSLTLSPMRSGKIIMLSSASRYLSKTAFESFNLLADVNMPHSSRMLKMVTALGCSFSLMKRFFVVSYLGSL